MNSFRVLFVFIHKNDMIDVSINIKQNEIMNQLRCNKSMSRY